MLKPSELKQFDLIKHLESGHEVPFMAESSDGVITMVGGDFGWIPEADYELWVKSDE